MTHSQITQCPHCQTRFRISDTQLRAAYGSVRCGACFKVFTAIQDAGPSQANAARPAPTPVSTPASAAALASTPTPASSADETLWIHDDLDLDSLDQALEKLEREQQSFSNASSFSALDEPQASAPLEALETFEPAQPITPTRIEPAFAEPEPLAETPTPTLNASRAAFSVDDEPLQLAHEAEPKRRGGWLVLGLVALLALLGQYLYFNLDTLARQPHTRPALESLCSWVGCSLPARVDISQIRSSNLSVREHAQFPGALMVDAIIYNRASYPQPFPLLEMRFSDINGEVLANREFRPSEYLAGELAGQSQMPPQTPIRIALEILDPGQNAVGYSLEFHSP